MFKSQFAAPAALAVLMLGLSSGLAAAQTQSQCGAAAARAADNIALRVQQFASGAENRQSASVHLAMASNAAAAGNEAECWRQIQMSSLFVPTPAGTQQPAPATASSPGAAAQSGALQSGGR